MLHIKLQLINRKPSLPFEYSDGKSLNCKQNVHIIDVICWGYCDDLKCDMIV